MSDKNELPAWDLSDLYKSIDDCNIKTDIAKVKSLSASFATDYKGKVMSLGADDFLASI